MTSAVIPEPKAPSRGRSSASTGEKSDDQDERSVDRLRWSTFPLEDAIYLADNSIVLLEDLFHVKEGDPSTRMYGHLGTHVQTMKKFAQQPLFSSRA